MTIDIEYKRIVWGTNNNLFRKNKFLSLTPPVPNSILIGHVLVLQLHGVQTSNFEVSGVKGEIPRDKVQKH